MSVPAESTVLQERSPLGKMTSRRMSTWILLLLSLQQAATRGVLSLSAKSTTRSAFLSSSVASLPVLWWGLCGGAGATLLVGVPEECQAAPKLPSFPRYLDEEVDVPYGQNPDGSPRTSKVLVRRMTGDATPYTFPVREVPLRKVWPDGDPPFLRRDFFRTDNNDDSWFYEIPRLVYHIDEPAVASLTQFYRRTIPAGSSILDICSSWVSHYPREFPQTMRKICATGVSATELAFNDQLSSPGCAVARDLNADPTLPFPDESFDVVTCTLSIDYLIHPLEVLREVRRVLKPGGQVLVSQSDRCFPTKAVALWLHLNDLERLELIDGYLKYAGGFKARRAYDITAIVPGDDEEAAAASGGRRLHDPMYVVQAFKA